MRFVLMAILIILVLSACSAAPFSLAPPVLSQIAPDVPAIPKQIQKQAAKEMQVGKCPALNIVVDTCLITRDEARILK